MKNASESMMKFICIMRDESWDAVERRGYCYKELGEEKFPKCGLPPIPFQMYHPLPMNNAQLRLRR